MGGSRDLCLGAKSPCHQGFNPGEIKFLFSKGYPPHAIFALVRRVLVTKDSTLVKLNFIFQRVPPSRDLSFGAKSPGDQVEKPSENKILNFTRAGDLVTRTFRTRAKIA